MFYWASYIDHCVAVGISSLWRGIYVLLWYPLAATLLPAELLLFLEGVVQHVIVYVVRPLAVQLLLLWTVDQIVVICANADGQPGRWGKAARRTAVATRVVVRTLFVLVLVCSGIDLCRSLFPSAPWDRADQWAADVSALVAKPHTVVFSAIWRVATWWYWLGGLLWQNLKFYSRSILLAGRRAVEWLMVLLSYDGETLIQDLDYPLWVTLHHLGKVLRSKILGTPWPSPPDRE